MRWLEGKVAIVTGSGQGIGRALAVGLAAEGARVITNNRREGTEGGDAAQTARAIAAMGGEAIPVFGDVADFEFGRELVTAAIAAFGRLDALINNATVYRSAPLWDMREADWDDCVDASLKGAFNCARHAASHFRAQRAGTIVSMTSRASWGSLEMCNYAASKAGIIGLTRSIAFDLGRFGVTANAVSPAAASRWTVSPSTGQRWQRRYRYGLISREFLEKRKEGMPPPETVAPLVAYLCSDRARPINGQIFTCRGRRIGMMPIPAETNAIEKPDGMWTVAELAEQIPARMLADYVNPAPRMERIEQRDDPT